MGRCDLHCPPYGCRGSYTWRLAATVAVLLLFSTALLSVHIGRAWMVIVGLSVAVSVGFLITAAVAGSVYNTRAGSETTTPHH